MVRGSGIELGCLVVEPLITGVDIEKGCWHIVCG